MWYAAVLSGLRVLSQWVWTAAALIHHRCFHRIINRSGDYKTFQKQLIIVAFILSSLTMATNISLERSAS